VLTHARDLAIPLFRDAAARVLIDSAGQRASLHASNSSDGSGLDDSRHAGRAYPFRATIRSSVPLEVSVTAARRQIEFQLL
jgi:hypothetical protein